MQQGRAGHSGRASEVLEPLSDALIQRCLGVGPWDHNGKPMWHRLLDWAVDAGVLRLSFVWFSSLLDIQCWLQLMKLQRQPGAWVQTVVS